MLDLRGLFAPIVTPLTDDGESLSEIRLAYLVRYLKQSGVDGFVCGTETGEFTTISSTERKNLMEMLIREARGTPVLAHCTRLGTAQTLDLCQHAGRHGAKAAVVMPPYFGHFSDEEIEQHIRRIVQHSGICVIVVDPQHLIRGNIRENLTGLPNLMFGESLEQEFRTRLSVFPAGVSSDEFAVGEVVVSPLVQIAPSGASDPEADLHPLARFLANHGRPRVAKAALNLRDIEVGPPRSPVLPLSDGLSRELAALLQIP